MALSLMAEHNDVRLAERPAHCLYFMGTKWIDLWVVYMLFTQQMAHPEALECLIEIILKDFSSCARKSMFLFYSLFCFSSTLRLIVILRDKISIDSSR